MGSGAEVPGVMWGGEVCIWTKGPYEVSSSITLRLPLLPHPDPRPGTLELMDSSRLASLPTLRIPSLCFPRARHADVPRCFCGC